MKRRSLGDQVVVIVGSSSGIGRATALEFARHRPRLVLAARNAASLADLAQSVRGVGSVAEIVTVDVADAGQVEQIAATAIERFGRIDTWVQLSAVSVYATFEATTPEEFRRVIEVNLLGQAYGAMAALPRLRAAGGGTLIEVSSVEAEVPLPYQSAYAASKHGMAGFLRALRMELEATDAPISVTQIMPAGMDTPLFDHARTKLGVVPRPVAPVYDPAVVARAIVHAAEHPVGDLYVGGSGLAVATAYRWLPGLTTRVLRAVGFDAQRSDRRKTAFAGDNLVEPLSEDGRVRGSNPGRRWSLATWGQLHPRSVALGVTAAVAGGLALARTTRRQ